MLYTSEIAFMIINVPKRQIYYMHARWGYERLKRVHKFLNISSFNEI